jgi:hypothetical protein
MNATRLAPRGRLLVLVEAAIADDAQESTTSATTSSPLTRAETPTATVK